MELIFNDLSLHGQFTSLAAFRDSIRRMMEIRAVGRQFGRDVQCHRNVSSAQVTPNEGVRTAVQTLNKDERRAFMQWLDRLGPFWEDARLHGEDDWLECNGEIVTGTAVAEAAWSVHRGTSRALVSLDPSYWLVSPLRVDWVASGRATNIPVPNFWSVSGLEDALAAIPVLLTSWNDLEDAARIRYPDLTFSESSFAPLRGHPFNKNAAERVMSLLGVLHELQNGFNERGERTPDAHRIYQEYFTGDNSWFSDSSTTEKARFRQQLTFQHPAKIHESLFCSWHGKVRTQQLRIHFSWPLRAREPLYVVYVGPKITRQ